MGGTLCSWKQAVKHTIILATKEKEWVKIPIVANIEILDNGQEIEFDDIRYDVIKKDDVHYFCYQDKHETHLINQILSATVAEKSNEKSSDFSIFKNIIKVYFIEIQSFIHFFRKEYCVISCFQYPSFFAHYAFNFFKPPQ